MARGNRILVSPDPKGHLVQGILGSGITTGYPGKAVQLQIATALQGGRHTWELYNVAADGSRPTGPIIILTEDIYQGSLATTVYAAGATVFGYIPLQGDELNLLIGGSVVAGTATIAAGTVLIPDDGTGLFIPTTGSPEIEPAVTLEATTDANTDVLTWCQWSGY